MLGFFKDAALTKPVTFLSPKQFLVSLAGGSRRSSLWLGDPLLALVTVQAAAGDNHLHLSPTEHLPSEGSVFVGETQINYTGKTADTLTGIPDSEEGSITDTIPVESEVKLKYVFGGNVRMFVMGPDAEGDIPVVSVSLKRSDQTSYGLSRVPVIFVPQEIQSGVAQALQVDMEVTCLPGTQKEFLNWQLESNACSVVGNYITGIAPSAPAGVFRRDQGLPQRLWLLPLEREVKTNLPGFILGEHRWRDESTCNAHALVPTRWDLDVNQIGPEKFISGIGGDTDLQLQDLAEALGSDSIYPRLEHGTYFSGYRRYYLPSDGVRLEFLPAKEISGLTFLLHDIPRSQSPVYVGTWRQDQQGYYEKDTEYRYVGHAFDPADSGPQFTLVKKDKELTLNQGLESATILVGLTSESDQDYFDLPIHPVDRIISVRVDNLSDLDHPGQIFATNYTFDRAAGTLVLPQVLDPPVSGLPVYVTYDPAVAVLYETGDSDTLTVSEAQVDLNPAFSGIPGGYLYLQHCRRKPDSIELRVDKPVISLPGGLVASGPVYFDGDYALLTATVLGKVPGELVPGVALQVNASADFVGLINYRDPLTEEIIVTSGGDGVANLVYTPPSSYGIWLDKTESVEGPLLSLPEAVPISQLYNAVDGWLIYTYSVINTNPLMGKAGGDPALGEVVFASSGTSGTTSYKTNGQRVLWVSAGVPVRPIDACDSAERSYTDPAFNGQVVSLEYADSIPVGETVGACFVSFLKRVSIWLNALNSNVVSNTIMLQLEAPQPISEDPFLRLADSINGRLGLYRLGLTPNQSILNSTSRF